MIDQKVTCELSDEEIKLAILELTARNTRLAELGYDEMKKVKEIFQWVKGE